MTTLTTETIAEVVNVLLTEAYAGPPNPSETWFIDNEPDSGILGLLANISAAAASKSADGSGQPGSSIASHAEHLRWSLANFNNTLRGQPYDSNWGDSWKVREANEADWERLRSALRSEFETARELLKSHHGELKAEYLTGTIALLPHAAYHLGNLRQMIERVRAA
jgi:hypothetical protein